MRSLLTGCLVMLSVAAAIADWSYDSKRMPMPLDGSSSDSVASQNQRDVQAILALKKTELDAINRHDIQSYFNGYLHSPELISVSNGGELMGFDAFYKRITKEWGSSTSLKKIELDRIQVKLGMLQGTAILRALYRLQTDLHVYDIETTQQLVKNNGEWKINFENDNIHRRIIPSVDKSSKHMNGIFIFGIIVISGIVLGILLVLNAEYRSILATRSVRMISLFFRAMMSAGVCVWHRIIYITKGAYVFVGLTQFLSFRLLENVIRNEAIDTKGQ
jgi:hypothetical protein